MTAIPIAEAETASATRWWASLCSLLHALRCLAARSGAQKGFVLVAAKLGRHGTSIPSSPEGFLDGLPPEDGWKGALAAASDWRYADILFWLEHAIVAYGKAKCLDVASRSRSFQEWVAQQFSSKHCRGLYRWTKGGSSLSPSSVVSPAYGGAVVNLPLQLAHHRKTVLQTMWCREPNRLLLSFEAMQRLKSVARAQPVLGCSLDQADRALFSLRDNTGLGLDSAPPRFFKRLPLEARRLFATLFADIECKLAWPWQVLANKLALLPKPDGDVRPIALMAMVVRWFTRCHRRACREWTRERAAFWDNAVAASSALRSATLTALRCELADIAGDQWSLVLWDFRKFYDSVGMAALARAATERRYPARLAYLWILAYQAPRVVAVDKGFSEWSVPIDSLLAGCGEAVNMSRCALFDIMETVSASSPRAELGQFVDDIKFFARGASSKAILEVLGPAVQAYLGAVAATPLQISCKSKVIGTAAFANKHLSAMAARSGCGLEVASRATDLGVDVVACSTRRLPKRASRAKRAGAQNSKVILLKHKRAMVRIHRTAVKPKEGYDSSVFGVPPSILAKRRAAAAKHCGWKAGMCTTTLFAIEGARGCVDPAVLEPTATVNAFLSIWLGQKEMRGQIADAWYEAAFESVMLKPAMAWRRAKGPVRATICVLKAAGWLPGSATQWTAPDGLEFLLSDAPVDRRCFSDYFADTLRRKLWATAASFHLGGGIEGLMDVSSVAAYVRRLRNKGDHQKAQLALMCACAGLWTKSRIREAGYAVADGDVLCDLCRSDVDTVFHRVYRCPVVLAGQDPDILSTNGLVAHAREDLPAIWCRGLVPLDLLEIPPPPMETDVMNFGNFSSMQDGELANAAHYRFFLDESGGVDSSDPRIRRCGWGIAALDRSEEPTTLAARCAFLGGWASPLAGSPQTATRACLAGLIFLLEKTVGPLLVFLDAKYLVDGYEKGRHHQPQGTHADLWHRIGLLVNERPHPVEVRKTKAHIAADQVVRGEADLVQWVGNHWADALAASGARRGQVSSDVRLNVAVLTGRSYNIIKRVTAANAMILELHGDRAGFLRPSRPEGRTTALSELVKASGHVLSSSAKTVKDLPATVACSECGQSVSKRSIVEWLREGPCRPLQHVHAHNARLDDLRAFPQVAEIRIARSDLHRSHLLMLHKGIWFCAKCGGWASGAQGKSHPRLLTRPCDSPSRAGRYALSRLQRGLTPAPRIDWPLPLGQPSVGNWRVIPRFRLNQKSTLSEDDFNVDPSQSADAGDTTPTVTFVEQLVLDGAESELSDGEDTPMPTDIFLGDQFVGEESHFEEEDPFGWGFDLA